MRKSVFILAFMLLCSMGFAQSNLPFTSLKPFNKGNFKIDASYSRMMQKDPFSDYGYRGCAYGIGCLQARPAEPSD